MPEAEEHVSSGWEITTACDMSLQPLFRGTYALVDIDSASITSTMQSLGPDTRGNLTFTATAADELYDDFSPHGGNTHGVAWRDPEDPTSVDVAVAVIDTPHTYRTGNGIIKLTMSLAESHLQTAGVLFNLKRYRVHTLIPETRVQEAAVHELQHAVDFQDADVMAQEKKNETYLRLKLRALAIGSLLVAPAMAAEATEMTLKSIPASIAVGVLTMLASSYQAGGIVLSMRRKAYYASPMEEKAYATSEQAHEFPPVITIKTQ